MIKTIIGIADIHIPLYKKLPEFRHVFKNFYKQLKKYNQDETIVVIAGDIAYAKSQLTPEFVILFKQFLENISKEFRTIIIPGNHDANLANLQRLDTITSMLYGMENDNITYYKDSGIYDYENLKFAVFSCLDGLKPKIPQDSNKSIIGLFHDTLTGSKNDFGYSFVNDNYSVKDFDYCDYVICGHIHKYQILQKRNKQKNKPEIFYTGSLLQQNHGQSIDGHGFVQLDLETGKHKLIEVKNDYCYLSLQFQDGQLKYFPKKVPKNVRLVVKMSNTDMNIVQMVINEKLSKHNIEAIKYLKKNDKNEQYEMQFKDKVYTNITNANYQSELIVKYIKNKLNVHDDDKLQLIKTLNNDYNNTIAMKDNDFGKN